MGEMNEASSFARSDWVCSGGGKDLDCGSAKLSVNLMWGRDVLHNVRAKWIRLTAPHLKVPPQLNRADSTLCRQSRSWRCRKWARRLRCQLVVAKRRLIGGRPAGFLRPPPHRHGFGGHP